MSAVKNASAAKLIEAARDGRLEEVIDLVRYQGVNVNVTSKLLETPVMVAAHNGHLTVVKVLVDAGADLMAVDKFGKTALIHAANGGHATIVEMLAKSSSESITSPCKWGFTARDWAEHNGHKSVSRLLVKIEKEVEERRMSGIPESKTEQPFVTSLAADMNSEDVKGTPKPVARASYTRPAATNSTTASPVPSSTIATSRSPTGSAATTPTAATSRLSTASTSPVASSLRTAPAAAAVPTPVVTTTPVKSSADVTTSISSPASSSAASAPSVAPAAASAPTQSAPAASSTTRSRIAAGILRAATAEAKAAPAAAVEAPAPPAKAPEPVQKPLPEPAKVVELTPAVTVPESVVEIGQVPTAHHRAQPASSAPPVSSAPPAAAVPASNTFASTMVFESDFKKNVTTEEVHTVKVVKTTKTVLAPVGAAPTEVPAAPAPVPEAPLAEREPSSPVVPAAPTSTPAAVSLDLAETAGGVRETAAEASAPSPVAEEATEEEVDTSADGAVPPAPAPVAEPAPAVEEPVPSAPVRELERGVSVAERVAALESNKSPKRGLTRVASAEPEMLVLSGKEVNLGTHPEPVPAEPLPALAKEDTSAAATLVPEHASASKEEDIIVLSGKNVDLGHHEEPVRVAEHNDRPAEEPTPTVEEIVGVGANDEQAVPAAAAQPEAPAPAAAMEASEGGEVKAAEESILVLTGKDVDLGTPNDAEAPTEPATADGTGPPSGPVAMVIAEEEEAVAPPSEPEMLVLSGRPSVANALSDLGDAPVATAVDSNDADEDAVDAEVVIASLPSRPAEQGSAVEAVAAPVSGAVMMVGDFEFIPRSATSKYEMVEQPESEDETEPAAQELVPAAAEATEEAPVNDTDVDEEDGNDTEPEVDVTEPINEPAGDAPTATADEYAAAAAPAAGEGESPAPATAATTTAEESAAPTVTISGSSKDASEPTPGAPSLQSMGSLAYSADSEPISFSRLSSEAAPEADVASSIAEESVHALEVSEPEATESPEPAKEAAPDVAEPEPEQTPSTPVKAEEPFDEDNEEHMTALIWASFHGEVEQVKDLVAKLNDVNVVDEHGMSALHFAANAGHLEVVKVLLAAKANIHALDENGSTPFHWATANCHLDVAEALLAAGANIDAVDSNGLTALLWAADLGHVEVLELLLKRKANIHAVDANGLNAVLWAADRGHVDCIDLLAKANVDVNVADHNGYTALHRAANGGYADVVRALIDAKANLVVLDKNGMTALDWAEEGEHTEIVEMLRVAIATTTVTPFKSASPVLDGAVKMDLDTLEDASQPEQAQVGAEHSAEEAAAAEAAAADPFNEDRMTALVYASHHGDLAKVQQLVAQLDDVNAADEHGMTALHFAASAGHSDVVRTLVAAGANVNAADEHKSTALHWACANRHLDVIQVLVDAKANLNAADQNGMTSLLWAADMGNLDVLELLIRCGADLDAQDENGLTALLWASDRGHVDCVRVLLAAHANVNSTDANSYTALHRASNAGSVEIVKALVEGKADLALVDKNGMTALDWAESQDHAEIVEILRRAAQPSPVAAPAPEPEPQLEREVAAAASALEPVVDPAAALGEASDSHDAQSVVSAAQSVASAVPAPAPASAQAPVAEAAATLQPAGDLGALRQALQFDASTVQYKDNVIGGRYYIKPDFPIHSSSTAVVVAAIDFGLCADYEEVFKQQCKKKDGHDDGKPAKMTPSTFQAAYEMLLTPCAPYQLPPLRTKRTSDELFAKYAKESKTGIFLAQHEFLQMCKDLLGESRPVVIKFMRNDASFHWEGNIRSVGQLSSQFVVGAITAVPAAELRAAAVKLVLADPSGTVRKMKHFPNAFIMPQADRSLDSIIRQERPDVAYTREMMRQVAEALQHLHQRGIMHGDLYALNIARIGGRMVLLDMDAAVEFGDAGSVTGAKYSSGVLPPEMFATLTREEEEQFEEYWREDVDQASELWGKICPVKLRNGSAIVVRTVHPDRVDGAGLPYRLVSASDMVDIWSFGLLLYNAMNPTGNSLFNVNQDGDLVRTEENFNAAANWTDDDLANAILHNIPDPLAADLLQKILRRNPSQRSDITAILAHPFFTDPSGKKREAKACQINILKQRKLMVKRDLQAEVSYHATEHLLDMSDEAFLQIKKTDTVLMRSVFEGSDCIVPTCFIIVNKKIVAAEDANPASGAITSSNWIEHLSDLGEAEEDLYLYLLDEYTMQPVLTVPGGASEDGNQYPFQIRNPAEFVPAVLPLLLLSMKATALLHGTASLVNSLGHPTPPVPMQQAVRWTGSLDTTTSLLEFSNLIDGAEEATVHLTGYNNHSHEAVKIRAAYVRDSALKTLRTLYAQHSGLYEHHHGTGFCGLRRVVVPGGFVCWTSEEGVANLKSGNAAATHLRLTESVA